MANLPRLPKSVSEWTSNDLITYNIVVHEQDELDFFGRPLPEYSGPAGFVEHKDRVQGLDPSSLALMKRLDLASHVFNDEESAVDAFVAELLRAMGYEREETVVYTQKSLWLLMCGDYVYAKSDVCVMDTASNISLVAQEDKSHIKPSDPEPQLIAEAIAAFQQNNNIRTDGHILAPLEQQFIHGITMIDTFPKFYKIKVTSDLDLAVNFGHYPPIQTVVYRHTPRVPGLRTTGMKPLDNRKHVLRCYEAFRSLVFPEPGMHLIYSFWSISY